MEKESPLPLQSHGTAERSRQSVDLHLDTHEVVRPDSKIKNKRKY
jgi:hypothetical protein